MRKANVWNAPAEYRANDAMVSTPPFSCEPNLDCSRACKVALALHTEDTSHAPFDADRPFRRLVSIIHAFLFFAGFAVVSAALASPANVTRPNVDHELAGLVFIDTSFENASPLWYDRAPDGTIRVHLLYDHEQASVNRAAGHIHFLIHATPRSKITLEFLNLDNVWNGKLASFAQELKTVVVSENGRDWKTLVTDALPGNRVRLTIEMEGSKLYVARVEPYRISDLNRWLTAIRKHPLVDVSLLGQTVQERPLEMVRVGRSKAPYRVFIRARAHPWESGGNWVVQGLIQRLLQDDVEARRYLKRYCVYVLPMANKDGVARGLTRFNLRGKDLNRDWDQPADPQLAPENAALEAWLKAMIHAKKAPHLAIDLHNDSGGLLHISRPPVPKPAQHIERMAVLEQLLRQHTWFTEGCTQPSFNNSGTLGDGWLERFGIDAVVHELNCNWIAGLKDYPSAKCWLAYGEQLATVLFEYFDSIKTSNDPARR